MLEEIGVPYKIIVQDIDEKALKIGRRIEDHSLEVRNEFRKGSLTNLKGWNREIRKFIKSFFENSEEILEQKSIYNTGEWKIKVPSGIKEKIKFVKGDFFTEAPINRSHITNCTNLFKFVLGKKEANAAFMNLVSRTKKGGLIHVDSLSSLSSDSSSNWRTKKEIEKHVDLNSYGLEMLSVRPGSILFRKKEDKNFL